MLPRGGRGTFREGKEIDRIRVIGPTFEKGKPCHECNSTFATTTLEILSPTRKETAALEMVEEEGTEIDTHQDTGPGERRTQGGRRRRRGRT